MLAEAMPAATSLDALGIDALLALWLVLLANPEWELPPILARRAVAAALRAQARDANQWVGFMRQARMAEDASSLHHIEPEEQDTEAPTDCRPKGMNEEGELLGRRVRNLLRVHHAAQGLNFTFGHWGKYTGDRENGATRALVNECLLHPLTIKFAGRWLCLKRVTSGGRKGFDELIGEISVGLIGDDGSHNANVLFALMNEAISPQISGHKTKIVRLCLAALVTVFYNESLTSVSKEVVNDFFLEVVENEKEIFSMDDRFYQSNGRRASLLVPEILGSLGILNITSS